MSHAPQVGTARHPSLTLDHPPSRFALPPVAALGTGRGTESRFGVQGRLTRHERSAFGPLGRLLDDPAVTDVFVTGGVGVWVDRGDGAEPETSLHLSEASARQVAVRLVSLGGRHVDESTWLTRELTSLSYWGYWPAVKPGQPPVLEAPVDDD